MLSEKKQLGLVREAIKDWSKNKLSNMAALLAISLIVNKQPPISKAAKAKVRDFIIEEKRRMKQMDKWEKFDKSNINT